LETSGLESVAWLRWRRVNLAAEIPNCELGAAHFLAEMINCPQVFFRSREVVHIESALPAAACSMMDATASAAILRCVLPQGSEIRFDRELTGSVSLPHDHGG